MKLQIPEYLERGVNTVRNTLSPSNRRLFSSSFGYPLVAQVVLSAWQEYGERLLTLFYDRNKEAYTPNQETLNLIRIEAELVQNECVRGLTYAQQYGIIPDGTGIGIKDIGSIEQMFIDGMEAIKELTPDQIREICRDPTELKELQLHIRYVIPQLYQTIMNELNYGFEAMRAAGIYMVAYSILRDKIYRRLIRPESGNFKRDTTDVFVNTSLACGSAYLNATLSNVYTPGSFNGSLVSSLNTTLLCSAVMSATRILLDRHFKDFRNKELVEYVVGAGTLLLIAGINSLTVTKFLIGLFG